MLRMHAMPERLPLQPGALDAFGQRNRAAGEITTAYLRCLNNIAAIQTIYFFFALKVPTIGGSKCSGQCPRRS